MSYTCVMFKSEKNPSANAGNVTNMSFFIIIFASIITLNTYNSPDMPSYVHHSDQLVDDTAQ